MKKRFYDGEPSTSQTVDLMLKFPDELQTVLANSMSQIAEGDYKADEILSDLKSLGTEKVLALYKSKQKKRPYDQNPSFHKAMNYMMVMTPQNRQAISGKVLNLMGHVQEYLQVCKEQGVQPTISTIENLAEVFVKQGPEQAKNLLNEIKEGKTETAPAPADNRSLMENVQEEGQGMRIKGELK